MITKEEAISGTQVTILSKTAGVSLNKLGCGIRIGDVLTILGVVGDPWEGPGFIQAYKIVPRLVNNFAPQDLKVLPK